MNYVNAWRAAIGALILAVNAAPSSAQNYPSRPIKFVIGFSAGTSTDIVARLLAQQLSDANGWTVVVENRPGQSGGLAAAELARTEPDGHTLSMSASGPLAVNPALNKKISYLPGRDYTPITQMVEQTSVLVVRSDFPAKTVSELVAFEKTRTGQFNYASIGAGTGNNITSATFAKRTGMRVVHVPYKGSPEAISSILAGDCQFMFEGLPNTMPHITAGTLRALAVSSRNRIPQLPDVPTVEEAGVPNFDMTTWIGLIGPPGLPAAVTDVLSREVLKAVSSDHMKTRLGQLGLTPRTQKSSAEFGDFIRAELAKWERAVEEAGVRVE